MFLNIFDKVVGLVDRVISGNFSLTREELEKRISKLEERKRRISRELEEARHRQYVRGWQTDEQRKENL